MNSCSRSLRAPFSLLLVFAFSFVVLARAQGPVPTASPMPPAEHPALFLVGDSTMQTGAGIGERGPWGWGAEIGAYFDPAKIHVYNEGRGGRSSRSYIEEGVWEKICAQLQPGDFVVVQFGHNDEANSTNYPDRATINSNGEETLQIGVGDKHRVIHTYGWYLRQYAKDAQAKGAKLIICSPVPRNQWAGGKIKRGFDGYVQWAASAAQASGAPFIDLNAIVCDRYDALGQAAAQSYFNDVQHTTKAGARLNAESVVAGIKQLTDCPLAQSLASSARQAH
jgi:rhamnogalacturonan acetylesterase